MTDPTKQPLPPTSPLAAALDAPLGGTAQPPPRTHRGRYSCPCCWTTPCNPMCPCVQSFSSRPCERCCGAGSEDQRKRRAERLAAIIDAGNAASRQPPPPATVVLVRTLASHLHDLAMRTPADPDKIPGADSDDAACRMAYLYGHRDARHAIAEALIGHPALREPAPVAADGAGGKPANAAEFAESLAFLWDAQSVRSDNNLRWVAARVAEPLFARLAAAEAARAAAEGEAKAARWYYAAVSKPGLDTPVEVYDQSSGCRAFARLFKSRTTGEYWWALEHDRRSDKWHISGVTHWRPLSVPQDAKALAALAGAKEGPA